MLCVAWRAIGEADILLLSLKRRALGQSRNTRAHTLPQGAEGDGKVQRGTRHFTPCGSSLRSRTSKHSGRGRFASNTTPRAGRRTARYRHNNTAARHGAAECGRSVVGVAGDYASQISPGKRGEGRGAPEKYAHDSSHQPKEPPSGRTGAVGVREAAPQEQQDGAVESKRALRCAGPRQDPLVRTRRLTLAVVARESNGIQG